MPHSYVSGVILFPIAPLITLLVWFVFVKRSWSAVLVKSFPCSVFFLTIPTLDISSEVPLSTGDRRPIAAECGRCARRYGQLWSHRLLGLDLSSSDLSNALSVFRFGRVFSIKGSMSSHSRHLRSSQNDVFRKFSMLPPGIMCICPCRPSPLSPSSTFPRPIGYCWYV